VPKEVIDSCLMLDYVRVINSRIVIIAAEVHCACYNEYWTETCCCTVHAR